MKEYRFALRNLWRAPGILLASVLSLALGIALVSTQYSLIDGLFLRPLPVANGERIWHVAITNDPNAEQWGGFALDQFKAIAEQQSAFDKLAGYRSETYNLVAGSGVAPQRLWGAAVSAPFFDVFGVQPLMGRAFRSDENNTDQPLRAVLSYRVWRDAFGLDPKVLGRSVRLNGELAEIIGVMPQEFMFPTVETVWVNLRWPPAGAKLDPLAQFMGLALLASDANLAKAKAELQLISERVRIAHLPAAGSTAGDAQSPAQAQFLLVKSIPDAFSDRGSRVVMVSMLAMTVFVLLLACINVANLLFVRASERMTDLSVRSALGASRVHLVRQLLAEGLLIALFGAMLGLVFAWLGLHFLQQQIQSRLDLSGWMKFEINARVLAVAAVVSLSAGLLAGLLPAIRASRVDLASTLRASGRSMLAGGYSRVRRWLVASQLAFACATLILAVMLGVSAARSGQLTLNFDPESVLVGRIDLQGQAYSEPAAITRFYQQLLERVRSAPGVAEAVVSSRDLVQPGVFSQFEIDGQVYQRANDRPPAFLEVVSRDYFNLVQRSAIQGRVFASQDRADSQVVAVVNASMAKKYFNDHAIGARIRRVGVTSSWATIVGVVPDLNMQGLGNAMSGEGWYLLQDQAGWGWLELLVRAKVPGQGAALAPLVRQAVLEVDPNQPVHTIQTLSERTARQMAAFSILSQMAMVFAAAALLLASVGVFGVVAHNARIRTQELGMRMAMGASGRRLTKMLISQNVFPLALGISMGMLFGYLLSLLLAPALAEVSPTDPQIYVIVATTLALATALACWLPARRAAKLAPMAAMRV